MIVSILLLLNVYKNAKKHPFILFNKNPDETIVEDVEILLKREIELCSTNKGRKKHKKTIKKMILTEFI